MSILQTDTRIEFITQITQITQIMQEQWSLYIKKRKGMFSFLRTWSKVFTGSKSECDAQELTYNSDEYITRSYPTGVFA